MKNPSAIPLPASFWKGLKTRSFGRSILFLKEVSSTNDVALRLANEGAPEGTVVVTDHQTKGRGRQGRAWSSSPGQSLLFTVVLRPKLPPRVMPAITLAAAVAVARACETFGVRPGIKWPNDLLIHDRKLCGILTEMGPKKDKMAPVVLGIGVNLGQGQRDFPKELRVIATSFRLASGRKVGRELFLRRLLLELEKVYGRLIHGELPRVLSDWRERSVTLGNRVKVTQAHRVFEGEAVDIDDMGALFVRMPSGDLEKVLSGDVETLRIVTGKRSS